MHFKHIYILVSLACLAGAAPAPGLFIVDDFSDGDYTNNPAWTVTSGTVDASGGELAFGTASGTTITLDFPAVVNAPVSVSYKLRQANGSAANFSFETFLVDTSTGLSHVEYAATNPAAFGPSGFHSWLSDGSNFATALPAANGRALHEAFPEYVKMQLIFDPSSGVEFYFEDVLMAAWPNFNGMTQVNQVKLVNGNGTLNWFVDDVVVSKTIVTAGPQFCGDEGTVYPEGDITGANNTPDCYVDLLDLAMVACKWLSCSDPGNILCDNASHQTTLRDYRAIQTLYRNGVPHTDKNGTRRTTYTPGVSFFPIGVLNAPSPGVSLNFDYDWNELVNANFNTVWPWPLMSAPSALQAGAAYNLQVVLMNPVDSTTLTSIKDHANLLGNMWRDEPPVDGPDVQTFMNDFIAYRDMAHAIAPQMPVFSVLVAQLTPDWVTWNQIMDVACHDNYPVVPVTPTIGYQPNGIPQSALLSVEVTGEQKPVWFVPGNFAWANAPDHNFPFRMPTVEQVRAQVYAAVIHGATGIHYFTWDSWISRDGAVIGMSPDPQVSYWTPPKTTASEMQMSRSLAVWLATRQLNSELTALTPAILSPTASAAVGYSVALTGQDVTDAPVRCILKQDPAGGYALLTVNVDEAVIEATYTFDSELASVEPLFENRSALNLPAGTHSFSQSYDPFEAHIFHIDLAP